MPANCASCHGIAGSGISAPRPGAGGILGEGPPLRGVGALAADFYLRTGYMPLSSPHDQPGPDRVLFSGKEITSLERYVASLGSGPAVPHPDPAAGSIAAGTQLFTRALRRVPSGTGARWLCHRRPGAAAADGERHADRRGGPDRALPHAALCAQQISDAQLNSIVKYVLSTRHPDNRGGWGIGNLGPIPEGLVTWWIAAPLLLLSCLAVGRRMRRP